MSDFVNDAFQRATEARAEAEAKAFCAVVDDRGETLMLTAIQQAGVEGLSLIFDWASRNGLAEVLHRYEGNLMFAGFHEGLKTKLDIE